MSFSNPVSAKKKSKSGLKGLETLILYVIGSGVGSDRGRGIISCLVISPVMSKLQYNSAEID